MAKKSVMTQELDYSELTDFQLDDIFKHWSNECSFMELSHVITNQDFMPEYYECKVKKEACLKEMKRRFNTRG